MHTKTNITYIWLNKFFTIIPNRLFIKNKNERSWYYIDEKEKIVELIDCLLDKGIKERKLKHNLKKTFEKRMNFMNFEGTLYDEADNFDDINSIINCSHILKKIEEKFSEYLNYFDKEWESLEIRNQWVILYKED